MRAGRSQSCRRWIIIGIRQAHQSVPDGGANRQTGDLPTNRSIAAEHQTVESDPLSVGGRLGKFKFVDGLEFLKRNIVR